MTLGTAAVAVAAFALLAPGVAAADTGPTGGPVSFAMMATPPKTVTSQYSCDLSAYGHGIPPVTLSATLSVPQTVQANVPLTITLKTAATGALPSSVRGKLHGVVSFDLAAAVTAQLTLIPNESVPLRGQTTVSGTLTRLPAGTATGSVTFPQPFDTAIEVPAPTVTFTPHTSTAALAAIACTTTAAKRSIPVTVIVGTAGPLYKCVVTNPAIVSITVSARFPMTVTSSGNRATGSTLTVTLAAGLGGFAPGTQSVKFTSDLPVTGAQSGTIPLSATITDLTSLTTRASGKLRLTKAGTDKIGVPEKFTVASKVPVQGGLTSVVVVCTIKTSPVPVGLTLTVAKGQGNPQQGNNGGQPQGGGTPVGAPATGGGSGQGSDLAVAAGGMALVVSGGGLALFGRHRRRR